MTAWRSLLFVPADDDRRLVRAHERGADAIILDLEDGVADEAKPRARTTIADTIARIDALGPEMIVRINMKWRDAFLDLEAAAHPGLRAVMVPKVKDAARLAAIAHMIAALERERGLSLGGIGHRQ